MKTDDFIKNNLIVAVNALVVLSFAVIFGLAHYEQRTYANDKKELFTACVSAGGKPELCLSAVQDK